MPHQWQDGMPAIPDDPNLVWSGDGTWKAPPAGAPAAHKAAHAAGGADALTFSDVGAAPPASSTLPAALNYGGAGTAGTVLNPTRRDHVHPLPKPTVADIDATGTRAADTALFGDGTWKVPAGGGAAPVLSKRTVDTTNSSTVTLTDIVPEVTLAANTNYRFWVEVPYSTPATTTGIVLTLGGLTTVDYVTAHATIGGHTADGTSAHFEGAITALGDLVTGIQVAAANTIYLARIVGVIRTGAIGGTFKPQYRSEVGGSLVTLKAGALMQIEAY